MLWGGVARGNVPWLIENEEGLVDLVVRTQTAIDSEETNHAVFAEEGFRFNAGMTKVYSLICRDFIIYDSRVAAALAWAVVKYCLERGLSVVPEGLRFPPMPTRSEARRNASEGALVFPRLTGAPMHVEWNMKASWLLERVLHHAKEKGSGFARIEGEGRAMRALESALFMLGYDLDKWEGGVIARAPAAPHEAQVALQQWESAQMAGGDILQFSVTDVGIDIEFKPDLEKVKSFGDEKIEATLLYLLKHFGTTPFPLANIADRVRAGDERNGMGTAWFLSANGNPPDTSRIAPALEKISMLARRDVPGETAAHWSLSEDLAARLPEEGVRPWLDAYRQRPRA